ncbi:hypothetical protein FWD07_01910 [Candidatus Saccharibacteria bacterium]|nr:hypothetical protein [Candidatus Saccharibacteria bacterium]
MKLPEGTRVLAEIGAGTRNKIDVRGMFERSCTMIHVKFLILQRDELQGVIRIEDGPEVVNKIILPFGKFRFLHEQEGAQFVPVIMPNGNRGLFDCRAGKFVLKNYDSIEIVWASATDDPFIREDHFTRRPAQARLALCKVSKGGKFGLIGLGGVDTSGYGFNTSEFGVTTTRKVFRGTVHDPVVIDAEIVCHQKRLNKESA